MITPEKFNKIVNKLPKDQKTELAKVELSFASDLKKSLNKIKGLVKKALAVEKKIESQRDKLYAMRNKFEQDARLGNKIGIELLENTDKGKKLLENVEKAAKELGVSPDNIDGYKEFKEVRGQAYFDAKRAREGMFDLKEFGL